MTTCSTSQSTIGVSRTVARAQNVDAPAAEVERASWGGIRRLLAHASLGFLMAAYVKFDRLTAAMKPRRIPRSARQTVLITGTFQSDNWVKSHLAPLAASGGCASVLVVSTSPIPPMTNVVAVYPPEWMIRSIGAVPARLAVFVWTALCERPDVIAGFHLLINGLVAGLLARILAARSWYFCVGGPMEVLDGGIHAENRLFAKLETPSPIIERRLIEAVGVFDRVITMGSRAARFFQAYGIAAKFHVIPGGIDLDRFSPRALTPDIDLILVGRLVPIKRIELLLRSIKCVAAHRPDLRAVIVGDGPLRCALEALARQLGIERQVAFVGHRADVEEWLKRSRIFVLTSESEGLALSLAEAMMCGVPAVVSDVGDLADIVRSGVNGYLVHDASPETFAAHFLELLENEEKRMRFGQAARAAAEGFTGAAATRQWDIILGAESRSSKV